jgi:hypothetical protein
MRNALAVMVMAACWAPSAFAQGIYTCVDSKGRRLTADRPIIDCIDREQKELNPSGTVRRKVGPSLTVQEQRAEEEKTRKAAEESNRVAEQKKRDRALLARFPDRARHDAERTSVLATVDAVVAISHKRSAELMAQRKELNTEGEFYRNDPARYPPTLKRALDENDAQLAAQKSFVAEQAEEKKRINKRFDEELARLRLLWAETQPVTAGRPASGPR